MLVSLVLHVLTLLITWSEYSSHAYPGSIQYKSVGLSSLSNLGCSECLAMSHSRSKEQSLSDKILACSGPYLFVGVLPEGEDAFELGAFGKAFEILEMTPQNVTNYSAGVYWYFTPGYSFGFLDNTDLQQTPIDTGMTSSKYRMSWSLSPTDRQEGYRVGSLVLNGSKSAGQKYSRAIFNCPAERGHSNHPNRPADSAEGAEPVLGITVDPIESSSSQPNPSKGSYQQHLSPIICFIYILAVMLFPTLIS
jgi:hypothetical protein